MTSSYPKHYIRDDVGSDRSRSLKKRPKTNANIVQFGNQENSVQILVSTAYNYDYK